MGERGSGDQQHRLVSLRPVPGHRHSVGINLIYIHLAQKKKIPVINVANNGCIMNTASSIFLLLGPLRITHINITLLHSFKKKITINQNSTVSQRSLSSLSEKSRYLIYIHRIRREYTFFLLYKSPHSLHY